MPELERRDTRRRFEQRARNPECMANTISAVRVLEEQEHASRQRVLRIVLVGSDVHDQRVGRVEELLRRRIAGNPEPRDFGRQRGIQLIHVATRTRVGRRRSRHEEPVEIAVCARLAAAIGARHVHASIIADSARFAAQPGSQCSEPLVRSSAALLKQAHAYRRSTPSGSRRSPPARSHHRPRCAYGGVPGAGLARSSLDPTRRSSCLPSPRKRS